jgi:hypothetical protein
VATPGRKDEITVTAPIPSAEFALIAQVACQCAFTAAVHVELAVIEQFASGPSVAVAVMCPTPVMVEFDAQ